MKKVFISGRIRGMPNLDHFQKAADIIASLGHIPVVPIGLIGIFPHMQKDVTKESDQWVQHFWLRESLKILLTCDLIHFCPGDFSSGMKLEHNTASTVGINTIFENGDIL